MSKAIISNALRKINDLDYTWSLYFFKIDKRTKEGYFAYKVRFKKDDQLLQYAERLVSCVNQYQVEPINEVQEYNGENPKLSCDKINLDDPLIKEQWRLFYNSIAAASDQKINGKINGYILDGHAKNTQVYISFIKVANPITSLKNNKSITFIPTVEDKLDLMTDDLCRLYLSADCIIYRDNLYTFNNKFEDLFNLEKTMAKLKLNIIEKVMCVEIFSDGEHFTSLAKQYKSSRTFLTFNKERFEKIKKPQDRERIANMLEIELDSDGNLDVKTPEEASLVIRYLCYKIFQENETNDVLEASVIAKIK